MLNLYKKYNIMILEKMDNVETLSLNVRVDANDKKILNNFAIM